jgi:methionyl-tRNA formyltransferase
MTDLPYGRGGSPLQNLILRGHKKTKLSALRMTEIFDAGPLYGQKEFTLDGSAQEIYQRAMDLAAELAIEIAKSEPKPIPQEGPVVSFKRRKPEESRIPALKDQEQLYDFIRMLDADGYPHAFLEQEGFRFSFRRATLANGKLHAEVKILPIVDGKESDL